MTIVWFSRHEPTSRQLSTLKLMYGSNLAIIRDGRAFTSAADIASRFRQSGASELLVVAPLTVIQALNRLGIKPLWAEMRPCLPTHPDAEVVARPRVGPPRHYRFIRFCRINSIRLDTTPLTVPLGAVSTTTVSLKEENTNHGNKAHHQTA